MGIKIFIDIDYLICSGIDFIVFGVVCELLFNVVWYFGVIIVLVRFGIIDEKCVLDVVDDGVGVIGDIMVCCLGEGYIGLVLYWVWVDVVGGVLVFLVIFRGIYVCVELLLKW